MQRTDVDWYFTTADARTKPEADPYAPLPRDVVLASKRESTPDLRLAEAFKCRVATESGRFAGPPEPKHRVPSAEASARVPGLTLIPNFITESEEAAILREVDQGDWSDGMERRVQHYGWQYPYRSRQIDSTMHIGALPGWADEIAHRLVDMGHFRSEPPDQVIVNEYRGSQGIAAHVDSVDSFTGVVAMVSLLESWQMVFKKKRDKANKVEQGLERRSATILEADARYEWTHEIPQRKTEPGPVKSGNTKPSRIPRDRRISLTFRKVAERARNRSRRELPRHR